MSLELAGCSAPVRVASSASSVQLVAANAMRRGALLYNESTAIAFVRFRPAAEGTTSTNASSTSYTFQMAPGAYYEIPYRPTFQGAMDVIWAAANGAMMITELV